MPTQVENGKAFEYSIAINYYNHLKEQGIDVILIEDSPYRNAKRCFEKQSESSKRAFNKASRQSIETLLILEPGLTAQKDSNDILKMHIAPDSDGEMGDVRDIVFNRDFISPKWEVGFSAKNNHEAVKHSRLSMTIDFGEKWVGHPCSQQYFEEINPVFTMLGKLRSENSICRWSILEDKDRDVYIPILKAFRKEMLKLANYYEDVPRNLLSYLIGRYPFYKIIKDDHSNTVVVKAFNLEGQLNKAVNGEKPRAKAEHIKFPTRIIELDFVKGSSTTLMMVLDEGWQISFRIHNASSIVEPSLKFDIQLIGNPPILFTQHLFNLDD